MSRCTRTPLLGLPKLASNGRCGKVAALILNGRLIRNFLLAAGLAFGCGPAGAAIFLVINKNDSGAGSFRQAVLDANATPGPDTVAFDIGGAAPYLINLSSALPTLTDAVLIDGTTQPGYAGDPLVAIIGTTAGSANGLVVQGGNSEVRALVIERFRGSGIELRSAGNVVAGCYLGLQTTGIARGGNSVAGVAIIQAANNRIGGKNVADRNLISGNQTGVYIVGLLAQSNVVIGNFIGLDVNGTTDLGNTNNGVLISAPRNTIGGTLAAERNIISANGQSGVYLNDIGAVSNRVIGNYIGTRQSGTAALSNSVDGVTIYQARENVIGGAAPGSGNVIAGNHERGILITGTNAQANRVEGNFIGTDAPGSADLGNRYSGVGLVGARYNLVGGTNAATRNVIAGNNQSGVSLESNALANVVSGNFIGLDATGTNALPNSLNGVSVSLGISNVIGGTGLGAGNVIGGNTQNGVLLLGGTATALQGNLIGTDATGQRARANGFNGVRVECAANWVGGEMPGARNIVSGNSSSGVFLLGSAASNNVVAGNYIGTDVTGTQRLGNNVSGIGVTNAPRNFLGTKAPGGGNVISGNADKGIYLIGSGATGNRMFGNLIGTDASGVLVVSNFNGGIFLYGSPTNYIGDAAPGARNVISGNYNVAISIGDPGANGNVVLGNFIGLGADGITPLGNRWHGVELLATTTGNIIGDVTPGAGNRIGYTQDIRTGVRVRDGCVGNSIRGNSIFANDALGIDLGTAGPAPNDAGDGDTGANNLQNFPVLTAATGRYLTTISGSFNSRTNGLYDLDFYGNAATDPTGYGEGLRYLGTKRVLTDGAGNAAFTVTLTNAVSLGAFVTATATDAAKNTSEFSANVPVAPSVDSDGDGLPDDYELAFGLNPNSSADRDLDLDGDGASNYQEFLAGTRANDAVSALRVRLEQQGSLNFLSFESVAGLVYRVVSAPEVTGPWTNVADNLPGTGGVLRVVDGASPGARFYRVRIMN